MDSQNHFTRKCTGAMRSHRELGSDEWVRLDGWGLRKTNLSAEYFEVLPMQGQPNRVPGVIIRELPHN